MAADVAQGMAAALGAKLDRSFYESLANSPTEAADLEFEARARDRERKVFAKHGME